MLQVSPDFNKLNSELRLQVLKMKADSISVATVEDLSAAANLRT